MRMVVPQAAATLVFTGRFRPSSFQDFAIHRARLLDLSAAFPESGPDRMVVSLSGQGDFIDAFEMACSLGPIDCLVLEVERQPDAERQPEAERRDEALTRQPEIQAMRSEP